MTEGRAKQIDRYLKEYDSKLYAKARYGRIDVLRKGERLVAYDLGSWSLVAPIREDHLVMSLTHDWSVTGRPVDWGIEPLLARLKFSDLWRHDIASDVIKAKERELASTDRALDNQTEAFWKENRRAWAKNFDTVNRSNLSRPDRRYRDDKMLKLKGY